MSECECASESEGGVRASEYLSCIPPHKLKALFIYEGSIYLRGNNYDK